jgi:hypothetical protein
MGDVLIARSGAEIRQSVSRRLKIQFEGAEPNGSIVGEGPVESYHNYILGSDPARWRTRIPVWSKIRQTSIYPGIDLIYHAHGSELEYDFIVAPGADPSRMRLRYFGARKARIDERGDLVLFGKFGVVRQHRPVAYQDVGGKRVAVDVVYHLRGRHATFLLGDYDKSHQLTIDPALTYATYVGGEFTDAGYAIATDAHGNAYVTGFTRSPGFPTSSRAF